MEYLVTMTTHVPDGTPDQAVDDVRRCGRVKAAIRWPCSSSRITGYRSSSA